MVKVILQGRPGKAEGVTRGKLLSPSRRESAGQGGEYRVWAYLRFTEIFDIVVLTSV